MSEMTLDELQNIARVMKNSSSNIYNLLGNLLEWSRMQRELTTFEPVSFILMPKINEILLIILDSATKKEISVNYTIPENLVVFADENMLASIIRNLVTNAIKFTPKQGNITVSAQLKGENFVEISVTDTGIGMNKKMIENLFILDVNTNRKGTDGELSTGLGLMICRDFIEKHGGRLVIKSEAGRGSTFSFILPGRAHSEGNTFSTESIPAQNLSSQKP
jgi:signal transduction histidine kinase